MPDERAVMATADINDLPDSDFAYIEPGGTKDATGRTVPRSFRHFPIHDAAHVRAALARASQSPFGQRAMPKIVAAAKKFGITVAGRYLAADWPDSSGRGEELPAREFARNWDLSDAHIRADGDGRIVEAYITPFERATEIHDQDGHYHETIGRTAFAKTLAERGLNFQVLYNHGRTFDGRTDGNLMIPIGVPRLIEPRDRGLYSETEFLENPLADAALEGIRKGALKGYSFTGRFVKSVKARAVGGNLATIHRSEVAMREYGPVLYPAYDDAQVVGSRMIDLISRIDPDDLDRLRALLGVATPPEPADVAATPPGAGTVQPDPVRQSASLSRDIRVARILRGID